MKGILKFQIAGQHTTTVHGPEELERDDMLAQLSKTKTYLGYQSGCIYHLDGSITILMSLTNHTLQNGGQQYTTTMTGTFKRI